MNNQPSKTPANESPKAKRRWFQFSLRTLLAMMLVFGCGLGWVASERRKNAKYRDHVNAIRELGWSVGCDQRKSIRPRWLQLIVGDDSFRNVIFVEINNAQVTDAGLKHLKGLTQLQGLQINNAQVTDAGLEHLKGLTQLQNLFLHDTQVTDAGLEHLKGLTQLRHLFLRNTQVTDAGIEKFRKAHPNCSVNR